MKNIILVFSILFIHLHALAQETSINEATLKDQPANTDATKTAETKASPPDPQADIKAWFAQTMWQKFIVERDPRLSDTPVGKQEIEDFIQQASRDGATANVELDELSRLVKSFSGPCSQQKVPNVTFGFEL
jgi:hypothetical protein